MKHPFWGAQKLADVVHKEVMDALSNRPEGAVVQVSTPSLNFNCMIFAGTGSLQTLWQSNPENVQQHGTCQSEDGIQTPLDQAPQGEEVGVCQEVQAVEC